LSALQTLGLTNTQVVDLTALQDLRELTKLFGVSNERLATIDAYRAQKGLPALSNKY